MQRFPGRMFSTFSNLDGELLASQSALSMGTITTTGETPTPKLVLSLVSIQLPRLFLTPTLDQGPTMFSASWTSPN